jgi:hypothetical protein
MSREDLQRLVISFYEAFNHSDWGHYRTIIAPDATYDEKGTGRKANRRAGCVAILRGFKISTPALRADPLGWVIDEINSIVAVDTVWRRTDRDEGSTVPGTVPGTFFFTIQGGNITHIREQHFFYASEYGWPPHCPLCVHNDDTYGPEPPPSP